MSVPVAGAAPRVQQSARGRRRAPGGRPRRDRARGWRIGWLAALGVATGALVAVRVVDVGVLVGRGSAGLLALLLATGLAARCGGRSLLPGLLVVAGAVAGAATGRPVLLATMAVVTGVLGAILAVMATTPAATFRRALREVLVAVLLAAVTALGVAGWSAPMSAVRFGYVALALALVGALVLVYSLGAGLHGLGRRGKVVAAVAVLLLAAALAYSQALARWGSPDLIDWAEALRRDTRSALHAVPHPLGAVLGIPALAWGVFMRARRRQGWWATAFGTTLTAPMTTRLLGTQPELGTAMLATGYTIVLGVALAWLVVRVEQALTGNHGRRARRDEEAGAHRPEPGRTVALR